MKESSSSEGRFFILLSSLRARMHRGHPSLVEGFVTPTGWARVRGMSSRFVAGVDWSHRSGDARLAVSETR